jgi:dihydrofolate reductase
MPRDDAPWAPAQPGVWAEPSVGGMMGTVVFDITMSLDGFITGANDSPERPLGEGGERLHDWISSGRTDEDTRVLDELFASGAVVAGRRTYDISTGPNGWGDGPLGKTPVFVVSHDRPEKVPDGGAVFTFASDIRSALQQAQEAAADKPVYVMGGADVAQQYLAAGLVDEVQIHLAPVLLGRGVRLFEHPGLDQVRMESTRVIATPCATHIRYRVVTGG